MSELSPPLQKMGKTSNFELIFCMDVNKNARKLTKKEKRNLHNYMIFYDFSKIKTLKNHKKSYTMNFWSGFVFLGS
jgi:hypothetical protein